MEPHTAPGHTGLDIDRSTFSRNRSYGGAGIQLDDVATLVSIEASTIAGNLPGVYLGPLVRIPQAELATTAYSAGPTPLTVTQRSGIVGSRHGCEAGVGWPHRAGGSWGSVRTMNSGGDPLLGVGRQRRRH
ncbi:MAG: hypothetical protein R2690_08200 [Acidimicrobiales bacterium]